MRAKKESALVICENDYERIMQLIEKNDSATVEALEEEISRADICKADKFPADAVSMDSTVTFIDMDSHEEKTISLVYPADADVDKMRISVLSPVGSALIGLRIGGSINWPVPQGKVRRLKVIAVAHPTN